jgi:hypothetical protein
MLSEGVHWLPSFISVSSCSSHILPFEKRGLYEISSPEVVSGLGTETRLHVLLPEREREETGIMIRIRVSLRVHRQPLGQVILPLVTHGITASHHHSWHV